MKALHHPTPCAPPQLCFFGSLPVLLRKRKKQPSIHTATIIASAQLLIQLSSVCLKSGAGPGCRELSWMWELRSTLDLCGIQDACENAMMVLRYPRPFYLDPGFDLIVSLPGLCTILMYYIICILHIMHNIINQCYWVSMKQWNQLRLANVARIQLQSRFWAPGVEFFWCKVYWKACDRPDLAHFVLAGMQRIGHRIYSSIVSGQFSMEYRCINHFWRGSARPLLTYPYVLIYRHQAGFPILGLEHHPKLTGWCFVFSICSKIFLFLPCPCSLFMLVSPFSAIHDHL